jgi:soluble lytic murein transglycosylase-like protein
MLACVAGSWHVPEEAAQASRPTKAPRAAAAVDANGLTTFLARQTSGLSAAEIQRLARTIEEQAEAHRIDPSLVLAVIRVESGFDAFAVSPAGAVGLMQILPSTGEALARRNGLPWRGVRTLFDPVANVKLGVAYLRELRDRFEHLPTALAAYNWGPGRIGRRVREGAPVPRSYARRVLSVYAETSVEPIRSS